MTSPEPTDYHVSLEEVIFSAVETLMSDGRHASTLIIQGSNGLTTNVLPDTIETHEEKVDFVRKLGLLAAETRVIGQLQQIFLIAQGELWEEKGAVLVEFPPHGDPNATEILLVDHVQIEEPRKSVNVFELVRDNEHQIIGLVDLITGVNQNTPLEDAFINGFQGAGTNI